MGFFAAQQLPAERHIARREAWFVSHASQFVGTVLTSTAACKAVLCACAGAAGGQKQAPAGCRGALAQQPVPQHSNADCTAAGSIAYAGTAHGSQGGSNVCGDGGFHLACQLMPGHLHVARLTRRHPGWDQSFVAAAGSLAGLCSCVLCQPLPDEAAPCCRLGTRAGHMRSRQALIASASPWRVCNGVNAVLLFM